MTKTDYFWTDVDQASERLRGSVILYDDYPVYVVEIIRGEDCPKAQIFNVDDREQKTTRKLLNSPKFARFRELPNLGWCNLSSGRAVFLNRRVAVGRIHGLTASNTIVNDVIFGDDSVKISQSQRIDFSSVWVDKGFPDCHKDVYPALGDILTNIREQTSIAYSRHFAVVRDGLGIRWLYKNTDRIGLFSGVDTLNILTKYSFLREEIMADKKFTLTTIREF